jgi:hypothetical protein
MKVSASGLAGSVGVRQVGLIFESELGWLFREQPVHDHGIDAQAEVVASGEVTGQLLALQIKSGPSWFKSSTGAGWWFRPDEAHVRYWLNHSLPVAVVLHDPSAGVAYWELVNERTLKRSRSGGWKLLVPSVHVLGQSSSQELAEATEGSPYELRLRDLSLALTWMHLLADGHRLILDIEEMVNKTSGRGEMRLSAVPPDGSAAVDVGSWGVMLGLNSYEDVLPEVLSWADITVHEETYEDADRDAWEAECIIWDEDDRFETESFADWTRGRDPGRLRPYADIAGEVDLWRLELHLNALGEAFLIVDDFARGGARQLTP